MVQQYRLTENLAVVYHSPLERLRCKTFWTKEPETLEWIKGFHPQGVFIDVGANIGLYSLFAASLYRKMCIYSLEPLRSNYQSLMRNIQLNGFDHITPLRLAASDREQETTFYILKEMPGSSGSQIHAPVGESGSSYQPAAEEKIPCTTIDNLCERCHQKCHYLKIDIDGREWQVLKGAEKSLKSSIQSVLVELNPFHQEIGSVHQWMEEKGFQLDQTLQAHPQHSNRRRSEGEPLNFIYKKNIPGTM